MRISEHGKTWVRPLDAWITVIFVTLLVGGLGCYELQNGRLPTAAPWMEVPCHGIAAGVLLFLWASFLVGFLPNSRNTDPTRHNRIYAPTRFLSILGPTLFLGCALLPSLERATVWIQNAGILLMFLMFLTTMSDFVTFGKHRPR